MRLQLERWMSPVSELLLVCDEAGMIRALDYPEHEARMHRLLRLHYGEYSLNDGAAPASARQALDAYFQGDMAAIEAIEVATGGTTFQRDVWKSLRTIPAGTTITYGQLAETVGRAGASRAVGAANGANPIAIIVPCHRVIGANGTLTGYAGGLSHKRWLLDHERRYAPVLANA